MSLANKRNVHLDIRLKGNVTPEPKEHQTRHVKDLSYIHVHPASPPDWNHLKVLHRNTLPPRSYFFLYNTEKAALAGDVRNSRSQLLSGNNWKFHLSPSPFQGPTEFWERDFDASGWADIAVPGMWQTQGFGKGPQYTNLDFPWPADPPHVPLDDNECGRYVTVFDVDTAFAESQLRLRFEGVDSAFTVWVNGKEIGYSQGARNPSEFDVTHAIEVGRQNTLAVQVYQRCDGTCLEDQGQGRLSGICRGVYLHSFPKTSIVDFQVQTRFLDSKYSDAEISVKVQLSNRARVKLQLLDARRSLVAVGKSPAKSEDTTVSIKLVVENPHRWTAETP